MTGGVGVLVGAGETDVFNVVDESTSLGFSGHFSLGRETAGSACDGVTESVTDSHVTFVANNTGRF